MTSLEIDYIRATCRELMRTLCIAIVLALFAAPGWASVNVADQEEVLIRNGIQLRKARDDLAARGEFQKAYDLTHSPRAAAQLGLAEFALGRWEDAEAHVSEALRAPHDRWVAKYRVELDQSLATIKTHVARVEVLGEPVGAEVFVNGRSVGRVPLAAPVAVSEGQVDVELRAAGFARATRTVTVQGGQYQRLVLRLEAEATPGRSLAATPAGGAAVQTRPASVGEDASNGKEPEERAGRDQNPTDRPADSDSPSVTRIVAKWTALGLATAGLATGIAASVVYSNNTTTFESLHGGGCFDHGGRAVDRSDQPVPECQPSLDAYLSARKWQIAGFVGAGLMATTWLVLTLTEPSSRTSVNSSSKSADLATWGCVLAVSAISGASCTFRF